MGWGGVWVLLYCHCVIYGGGFDFCYNYYNTLKKNLAYFHIHIESFWFEFFLMAGKGVECIFLKHENTVNTVI